MPLMYAKPALYDKLENILDPSTECATNKDTDSDERASDSNEEITDGMYI